MKIVPIDSHHVEHPFQKKMLEKLWEPITIGGMTAKNRIVLGPLGSPNHHFSYPNMIHDPPFFLHETLAKGGAGIIIVGETDVSPKKSPPEAHETEKEWWPVWRRNQARAGQIPGYCKGIFSDENIPGWAKLIDECHKWGAKVWPQLWSNAIWAVWPIMIRGKGEAKLLLPDWKEVGMTPEALGEEAKNFAAAAARAKEAGADGVEFHSTAENLHAILASTVRNPGVPGYCENFEARTRFARECIQGIKKACGKDFVVAMRLSPVEYIEGGYGIEYSKQLAKAYIDAGLDYIDVAQAGFTTQVPQLPMVDPSGAYAHYARAIKDYLTSLGPPYSEVIISSTCRINNPWLAASMLRNGDCDVVSLCRQLVCDPDWPNKIKEGRIDDIIPCIACGWCMHVKGGLPIACTMNPQAPYMMGPEAREKLKMTEAKKVKKVLVAGGGLAGMEAARVLALRGHKVTLCEKEEELGRMLHVQSYAPYRADMDLPRKYLSTQVRKLGVDVRCNQEVTPALVEKEKPDTMVVATGCRPILPEIPGIDKHPHVVFAEDVLLGNADVLGKRVVVIDADAGHDVGSLGSFAAQFVARSACVRDDVAMHITRWSPVDTPEEVVAMNNTVVGKEVTIVTKRGRIADVHYHHYTTMEDLRRLGAKVLVGCEYKEINNKGLVLVWGDKKEELLEADTIITAQYESNNDLHKKLEGKVTDLHLIGDAKAVRLEVIATMQEAHRFALTI
ncbi:FAD-dependent oxidoreductase [Chloroflexota bacterium]